MSVLTARPGASHMLHALPAALLAAIFCTPVNADVDDSAGSMFSFNGFGTLGAVHSSEANVDFTGGFFQPNGAGYTHRWSLGVDSKLGLQIDARLTDKLSAVVQLASQHQYDNHYDPQIEWANIKYQLTPNAAIRVGRTVSSLYSVSDSGLVGYSNPWVRPPEEIYGLLPIKRTDGVDVSWRSHFRGVTNSIRASYGQFTANTPGDGEGRAEHIFNISDTLEYGAGSVRLGYLSSRLSLRNPDLDALFNGFRQFGQALSAIPGLQPVGAQALSIASRYELKELPYSIVTVGANYDADSWFLMSEWATVNAGAAISDMSAWYVTGGYRIRKFTPFLTYARSSANRKFEPGIVTMGLPSPLAESAAQLNGGLDAVIKYLALSQSSVSAGVRWDFARSAALKLQYDRLIMDPDSNGSLSNVQPAYVPGTDVNLFSIAIDFVF